MVNLVYYWTNLLFYDIPLLYFSVDLRSSIIFCLSTGDIYLSLGIYLSCPFVIVSELFSSELLDTFVIMSVISLPIKSPVASFCCVLN